MLLRHTTRKVLIAMSSQGKWVWGIEIFIAIFPILIRMLVIPAAGHHEFMEVAFETLNSAEATTFSLILFLTTLTVIAEKFNYQNHHDAFRILTGYILGLIILLVAIFCNLAFNVPNTTTTTTCFYRDVEVNCPYMMETVKIVPSYNGWWCAFNIGAGIISVLACTLVRNKLKSASVGDSEKEN